jgi:predicted nucleic-acid-binding protein
MKALDTNIIVRFLVNDDAKQAQAVYHLFKETEAAKGTLFVPLMVVLETIWVLESVYSISRHEIIEIFKELLLMPILKFESQPAVQAFIESAMNSSTELADILIAQSARHSGCESILTLDKRASKSALFELLR